MKPQQHVLVVDDDPRICRLLSQYLQRQGFGTTIVHGEDEMFAELAGRSPDLILLDLVLPDANGIEITRKLRRNSKVPIIIITGEASTVDKVLGLELGADDYVTKPFDERELLARVRAVLRRYEGGSEAPPDKAKQPSPGNVACFAGWRLHLQRQELGSPAGKTIPLTYQEFRLLSLLVENPDQIFDRNHLLESIAGRDWHPNDRSVDVLVGKLRKKIESDPKHPELIRTQRGVGYRFGPEVKWE